MVDMYFRRNHFLYKGSICLPRLLCVDWYIKCIDVLYVFHELVVFLELATKKNDKLLRTINLGTCMSQNMQEQNDCEYIPRN